MAKQQMQKNKLLLLLDYFERYTDEEHTAGVEELISYLASHGISAERKAIYSDIDSLISYGADIIKTRVGRATGYYLASRVFETAELKMLVDIIEASRFVTAKKSEQLISKIETLCSVHDAKKLSRHVYMTGRVKAPSEIIYLSVDKIHSAFVEECSIEFKYFYYNWKKEKCYRRDGALYKVVPLALMWNNDNYYLIAMGESGTRHFRVDKMECVSISSKLTESERESVKKFDPARYSKSVFDMYGGERLRVELSVPEILVGSMFDRFGMDAVVRRGENSEFILSVEVELSPSFFAWISTFEGQVQIVSPDTAISCHREHIKKMLLSVKDI